MSGRRHGDVQRLLDRRTLTNSARAALAEPDRASADAASRSVGGQGVSAQAFAIFDRILEVNGHLPRARARLLEGHPEVSFREMARLHGGAPAGDGAGVDRRPLAHGKASAAGLMLRADLLAAAGIAIPRSAHDAVGTAALDDVYDAAAMAWTARRVAAGRAGSLPGEPEVLSDGVASAIRYSRARRLNALRRTASATLESEQVSSLMVLGPTEPAGTQRSAILVHETPLRKGRSLMRRPSATARVAVIVVAATVTLVACSPFGHSENASQQPTTITSDHHWYALVDVTLLDGVPSDADRDSAMSTLQMHLSNNGPEGAYAFRDNDGQILVGFLDHPSDATITSLQASLSVDFRQVWLRGGPTDPHLPLPLPVATGEDQSLVLAAACASLDCTAASTGAGAAYGDPTLPLVACARDGLVKYLLGPVELDSSSLKSATSSPEVNSAGQSTGGQVVDLTLTGKGAMLFGEMTQRLSGLTDPLNSLAITLDGFVVTAPTVQSAINAGQVRISLGLDKARADALAEISANASRGLGLKVTSVVEIQAPTP